MKTLAVIGVITGVLAVGACIPPQEINVSVNKQATITSVVTDAYGNGEVTLRLSGYLWCNRPVGIDFFVSLFQDGTDDIHASSEHIGCQHEDPTPWSHDFEFTYTGPQLPHTGNATLHLQASTNESGGDTEDSVNVSRGLVIS